VVGIHGPQGAGKSTLCELVVAGLGAIGRRAASVSIDDFYLTHAAQRALAAAHPGNPTLEHRGYPGTHDLALGEAVLDALARDAPGVVRVPVYDKSAHGGRGDRAPEARWRAVTTPLDAVLLEGWMLAFRPVAEEAVPEPALRAPNALLAGYAGWRRRLEVLVELAVEGGDLERIVAWRVDAERARRAAGAPGLDDAAAHDYVRRFLPAYRLWTPALARDPGVPGRALRITLGPDRQPRDVIERS
jgi:D-glycerate 3-kinase